MGTKHLLNNILRVLLLLVIIGIAVISILLIIKPGAAIFHFKQPVNTQEVKNHEGQAYRYAIGFNALIFPAHGGLLYEDGQPLVNTFTAEVVEKGYGKYSLVDQEEGSYFLTFSASDNSDPRTNKKVYTLYLKPIFLSRTLGITLLGIIVLGISWFVAFSIKPENRKVLLKSFPVSAWQTYETFLEQEVSRIFPPIQNRETITEHRRQLWIEILIFSIGASFLYILMEWIFFVTKPSFMDLISWVEKLELIFLSSFALAILSLVSIMVLASIDFLSSYIRSTTILIFIGLLIPSILLATNFLLLVDNFTYSIFRFGIVTSVGIWRYAYGLGFLILIALINAWILNLLSLRGEPKPPLKISRFVIAITAGLFIVSAGFALIRFNISSSENTRAAELGGELDQFTSLPNILIIGSDGLNASNLSVYGYDRETTPILNELAQTSLVAENAFANSSNSAGSITSMLTGKPAAQTRVLHPPNILNGADAYQHLPGLLRKKGYHSVEIGVRHYVDAYHVNMLDGFDTVNDRSLTESKLVRSVRELGLGVNAYFATTLVERISDRILHIFFIREMENPFAVVNQPVGIQHDQERKDQIEELIRDTERPLFLHVHMMGTHGPFFSPDKQKFSVGKTQDEKWMTDFYDDSILTFDNYVGAILEDLEQADKIDNTILIIYSDHPMVYDVRLRVPLLMHFPKDEHAGQITSNAQNLDIAPTILDYLGMQQPLWMEGRSLLEFDPTQRRLIFNSGTSFLTDIGEGKNLIASSRVKPPFFQFTLFNVIDCHKWYRLDLINMAWESGEVTGHTKPCSEASLLSLDQIKESMAEYLSANGFDISTLQ